MNEPLLCFNGIDATTGEYLLPPMSIGRFAAMIRRHRLRPLGDAKGVVAGIDATRPAEAGWGVVFPRDVDPGVRDALRDLCEHRKKLATAETAHRFRELTYLPGESSLNFLARHGSGPGPVDPDKVPYYLMIVGDPQAIPFSFQYRLDFKYAVGRIAFATPGEYAGYARSVVNAESGGAVRRRRASFFAVENPDDRATELSSRMLVQPLASGLAAALPDWEIETVSGQAASKARLGRELHGADRTAFLFTAGHAAFFSGQKSDHQRDRQGALVLSDWPGPRSWTGAVPEAHYFAARDLDPEASVHGLVGFHFACFSGGTPRFDAFAGDSWRQRVPIAPAPFVAHLPQRLLAHPRGGALAVIGHVDRAWETSFLWQGAGAQLAVFRSTLRKILEGCPVGHAMDDFGQRYAELAMELQAEKYEAGERTDDLLTARLWTAYHDARGYVLLGDPAVRLMTGE